MSPPASHPLARRTRFMKSIGAVVLTSLVLLPVRWQPGMTATTDPKTEKVVDTSGNLRVPGDYRTAYHFLGSWAVSADQGPGSKEIHVVYASPGAAAAYRKNGRFTDGSVLVKEVFETATGAMTTRHCQSCPNLKGLKRGVSSTAPVQHITLKREEAYVSQDSRSSDSKRICGVNCLGGGNIRAITC